MNKRETFDVMTYIFADHDAKVTDEKLAVWHDQFKHITFEHAMTAARMLISKKSFGIPKAHDLHAALSELEESKFIDEGEAWNEVNSAAARFGRNRRADALAFISIKDQTVAAAAENIWTDLCMMNPSDVAPTRAHFWKILKSIRSRHVNKAIGIPKTIELKEATTLDNNHHIPNFELGDYLTTRPRPYLPRSSKTQPDED